MPLPSKPQKTDDYHGDVTFSDGKTFRDKPACKSFNGMRMRAAGGVGDICLTCDRVQVTDLKVRRARMWVRKLWWCSFILGHNCEIPHDVHDVIITAKLKDTLSFLPHHRFYHIWEKCK